RGPDDHPLARPAGPRSQQVARFSALLAGSRCVRHNPVMPRDLTEAGARALDSADTLRALRDDFFIPPVPGHPRADALECIFLCGTSLGCMPRGVTRAMQEQLEDWANLGVEAHFSGRDPWFPYHDPLRAPLARLVGAREHEVVAMNSLTVNLHLLMAS